jgi:CheY-like chemotaxis protein/two-component sensor histidine kinase
LALISQILDLSKIEAGRMEIERRRTPLAELRAYIDRSFQPLAQQKGIEFSVEVRPEVPPTLTTDGQRLEQILKNLLSNAFKFTQAGRINLSIQLCNGGTRFESPALRRCPGVIAFAVTDTGIGIAEEKQQVIFEAFQQGDASTSRTYGGTGLGLTISRELARLLGGEIALRSSPGAGSTFTLFMPLAADDLRFPPSTDAPPPLERGHRSHESGDELPALRASPVTEPAALPPRRERWDEELAGRKVMVVDDDVRNLFAVISLLERHRVEVIPASSGREALEVLRRRGDVELVLMDVMMPEMDGFEATRTLRRLEGRADIPVVALTAKAMPGDRERCIEAGCNDFVPKPVDPERLLDTLSDWLSGKRTRS